MKENLSKGEETRRLIIERSAPVFMVKGIAATSMSDVMEAASLSKATAYVHFENKDILATEAVKYNMELLANKVRSAVDKEKTAKGQLLAYLDVFKDPIHPPVEGGCPMINFGMEADDTNPAIAQIVNQMVELSQELIADIIQRGINNGEFNPSWNYKEFATIMFAMIEGGVMICRVNGNNQKMRVINNHLKKMIEKQVR